MTVPDSGAERCLSLITDVHVVEWGRLMIVEGLDDPLTRNRFQLIFRDCRELHWSQHAEGFVGETEADVIGICPGKDHHHEPAVLTTDFFELAIHYGPVETRRFSPIPDVVEPLAVR